MANIRRKARDGKSPKQGIRSIAVEGYKSVIDRQTIELRPLTILAGANSSGKSSIMQPLLLIKQTLDSPYDPGGLLLNGSNVRMTSAEQLLSRTSKSSVAKEFSVCFKLENQSVEIGFSREKGKGIVPHRNIVDKGGMTFELGEGCDREALLANVRTVLKQDLPFMEGRKFEVSLRQERVFWSVLGEFGGKGSLGIALVDAGQDVSAAIRGVIHVPGLRGNPSRDYPTTAVEGDHFPGTFESYVASLIYAWQRSQDDRLLELGQDLEALGLTWKVQAERIDDTRVELKVGRLPHPRRGGAQDLVSIADVGFGVSQTLPVLVALLVAQPGQIVYLEQPEIHLHPRAQWHLAGIVANAARRGVCVVLETHSSLLLRGVQTLVAKGDLSPHLAVLHWVSRSDNGATKVDSAEMDETGALGDWPVDFDDVTLTAEADYLDAAEARLFQTGTGH